MRSSRMSSTVIARMAKKKMSDLNPGDLVRVHRFPRGGDTFVGTVIDGPFYQEPDDPNVLGWWSYKILSLGSVQHIYENHLEPLDETVR